MASGYATKSSPTGIIKAKQKRKGASLRIEGLERSRLLCLIRILEDNRDGIGDQEGGPKKSRQGER